MDGELLYYDVKKDFKLHMKLQDSPLKIKKASDMCLLYNFTAPRISGGTRIFCSFVRGEKLSAEFTENGWFLHL